VKLKQDFSKGEKWNVLAEALGVHAGELVEATKTKDHQATSAALTATRATCRACHSEFK
jgi:cytochrome c556